LVEGLESSTLDAGVMDEDVWPALLLDEAKALLVREPLYRTCLACHLTILSGWSCRAARLPRGRPDAGIIPGLEAGNRVETQNVAPCGATFSRRSRNQRAARRLRALRRRAAAAFRFLASLGFSENRLFLRSLKVPERISLRRNCLSAQSSRSLSPRFTSTMRSPPTVR